MKNLLRSALGLLIICLSLSCPCIGQEKMPTLKRTLGSNQYANVHCGLVDKTGNLWFGTTGEGVYRYDGKRFTQFTVKDGLTDNKVWCILEDRTGMIWIGTDGGLCRFDGKSITRVLLPLMGGNGTFQPVFDNVSEKNAVSSMLQDKTGGLWFGTAGGLFYYSGGSFKPLLDGKVENSSGVGLKNIQCMLEDNSGNLWFGSGPPAQEGLCRYDGKSIVRFTPGGEQWIRYMLADRAGNIWLGTRQRGLWRYANGSFTKFKYDQEEMQSSSNIIGVSALIDRSGNLWLSGVESNDGYSGDGNVWRYDGKTFTRLKLGNSPVNYGIWCMIEDRAGNIWIGTRNTGLYRFDGKTFTDLSDHTTN